jgi:CheY-like chemotaxis protein
MHAILMIGRDLELLRIRRMLIERDGHQVQVATEPQALCGIDTPLDLLIFCHTLPAADGKLACEIADRLWPDLPQLALITWSDHPQHYPRAQRAYIADGPGKLLFTIETLLAARPLYAA